MKFKHCITLAILSIVSLATTYGQQDSQYTQYMYNTETINPAYAGNRGMFSLYSLYRAQWVGLEGAPRTVNISMNTPVGFGGVGLGLSFYQDEIGPSKENNLTADFSYTIQTSEDSRLSFGIKGGFNLLDVNFSDLVFNPLDPNAVNIDNRFSPVVGAGVYFHSSDKWYVGLSTPNFINTEHYEDVTTSTATEKAHFYLMAGYVFNLSDSIKFKPAALAKAVVGAPLAVDATASFMFNNVFTLGAAYRWDAAVSALVGFQLSDNLMIGYAYDYDTTELGNYNSGSHEIFLRFDLINKVRRAVNPRFF
ncbi:type IX secretion system membrane protein PorP/SprF [Spongiimicrobium sp. 3-5]|uniref:PorP/SprF family type IX secretion system membrane protein n=1 Tax=Spongiimicrobium sp. 3-5 TaxID=3332596 RepID=UPI003980A787